MKLVAVLAIAVAGCAVLKPGPPRTVVRVDTITITKEVAPPLLTGDSAVICLSTGMPARVLITATGDTLVGDARVRIRDARPLLAFAGAYAGEERWLASDTLRFDKRLYRKIGPSAARACEDLKEVGRLNGVPVFADATAMASLPTILLPVRPGIFQPYTTAAGRRRR